MFSRWGAFVYRRRRVFLVLAIVVGLAGAAGAGRAASVLSAGGWLDPGSESAHVSDRLATEFGAGRGTLIALFRGPAGADATSAAFQSEITRSLADLVTDPDVAGTVGYAQTGDSRFIATAGNAAYVVIDLNVTDEESVPLLSRFESRIQQPGNDIQLLLGGYAPLTRDSAKQSEEDLIRAETVSLPIAALVLILVFTSLLAAGHPAPGRGARDPDHPGARLDRRPAGGDEHLRPERVHDAGPRPRDRLLAVHGQPVPRGAATAGGAWATRSRSRSPRRARPSRSRASRSRPGWAGCSRSAPRRSGRSASAEC